MMREMCQVIKEKLIIKIFKNYDKDFEDSKQKAFRVALETARAVIIKKNEDSFALRAEKFSIIQKN
jgi:hypothetical protein